MYQFLCGFCVGVFFGTRYDLAVYVDSAEFTVRRFVKELESRAKTPDTDQEPPKPKAA